MPEINATKAPASSTGVIREIGDDGGSRDGIVNVGDGVSETGSSLGGQQQTAEYFSPARSVVLSGERLTPKFLGNEVQRIIIDETVDGMNLCLVDFTNTNLKYTNEEALSQYNTLQVFLGYSNGPMVRRGARFIMEKSTFNFDRAKDLRIRIVALGEEWPLARTERRREFINMADWQIVQQIAQESNFSFDIEKTLPVLTKVVQLNQTDLRFLEERAALYGFEVYIEDNVLHFHQPRFNHTGFRWTYGVAEQAGMQSFAVTTDPWFAASKWTASQVDPLKKTIFEVTPDLDDVDPLSRRLAKRDRSMLLAENLSAYVDFLDGPTRPTRFLIDDGHLQTKESLQKVANAKFRSSRWMLRGAFDTVAAPSLKPRNVIDIVGIGRFSGSYYVTRVVHKFDEGYTQSVEVARFGHNPFSPTLRDVQTGLGSPGAAKEVTGKSKVVRQVSIG